MDLDVGVDGDLQVSHGCRRPGIAWLEGESQVSRVERRDLSRHRAPTPGRRDN